jgi:hypothetical protein
VPGATSTASCAGDRSAFGPAQAPPLDGTSVPEAPNLRWGTDATVAWDRVDGRLGRLCVVDHCTAEARAHVAWAGDRFAARQPVYDAIIPTIDAPALLAGSVTNDLCAWLLYALAWILGRALRRRQESHLRRQSHACPGRHARWCGTSAALPGPCHPSQRPSQAVVRVCRPQRCGPVWLLGEVDGRGVGMSGTRTAPC